jgi:nucleoside-diphosphate-sugar epimerase
MKLAGTTVCVTGGAGFIGSHLVYALVARGASVRVIDDLSTGAIENLAGVKGRVEVIQQSVLKPAALDAALRGASRVFHLAAYVSAAGSVKEPELCHEINTGGTLRLLEACRRQNVARVVLASSAAVYGDSEVVPKVEDHPILPCSTYAQSKAAGEHLLRVWRHCHGLEGVSLRFFNVFGPRQTAGSAYAAVIAAFGAALLEGKACTIYGDGSQTRDFVPVGNVVQALLRAAETDTLPAEPVFNIGMGTATTISQLATLMSAMAGSKLPPVYAGPRAGDVKHSVADISKARRELGYSPDVTVEDGLNQTVRWYRETFAKDGRSVGA